MDMMLTGKNIPAKKAKKLGLVDHLDFVCCGHHSLCINVFWGFFQHIQMKKRKRKYKCQR
jgi:hypothetical protein